MARAAICGWQTNTLLRRAPHLYGLWLVTSKGFSTGDTHESGGRLGSARLRPHLAAHLSSGGTSGMPQGVHRHDYPKGPVCVFVGEGRGVWVAGRPIFLCMGGSRRRDVATPWFRCPGASARHPERVEVQPRGSGRACGVGGAGTMPIACTWRGLLGERHVPIGPISRSASAEPPSISPSSQPRRCAPGGPGRRGGAFIRCGSDSRARGRFREIDMTCKIDPNSRCSPGGGGGRVRGVCGACTAGVWP